MYIFWGTFYCKVSHNLVRYTLESYCPCKPLATDTCCQRLLRSQCLGILQYSTLVYTQHTPKKPTSTKQSDVEAKSLVALNKCVSHMFVANSHRAGHSIMIATPSNIVTIQLANHYNSTQRRVLLHTYPPIQTFMHIHTHYKHILCIYVHVINDKFRLIRPPQQKQLHIVQTNYHSMT